MTEMQPIALTTEEARTLTDEVKSDARALWGKLLGLYERKAHMALGYTSWAAYCMAEFNVGYTAAYRMLEAARVVDQLPIGNSPPANEAQARELARLPDPEARAEVWAEVQAEAEQGAKVTAETVRAAVSRHPKAPPVRAVPEPDAAFPDVDAGPQWQCAGCSRWYPDDVSDCPDCQQAFWPEAASSAPTAPPSEAAEPFELPPASLTDEQKAFYRIAACVHMAGLDPDAVAAAPKDNLVGPSANELHSLADWLQRVVAALRARQERPNLRAVK